MKAYRILFGAQIQGLQLHDEKAPVLGPHDVRVAIRAVSLNFRDLMFARGTYAVSSAEPRIPTSDGAGEVIEVGPKVSRFKVGERVASTIYPKWIEGEPTVDNSVGALGARGDGEGSADGEPASMDSSWFVVPDDSSESSSAAARCSRT
jgi:NADPH:quinone reductase-like Zn-dependent oxidoreductase